MARPILPDVYYDVYVPGYAGPEYNSAEIKQLREGIVLNACKLACDDMVDFARLWWDFKYGDVLRVCHNARFQPCAEFLERIWTMFHGSTVSDVLNAALGYDDRHCHAEQEHLARGTQQWWWLTPAWLCWLCSFCDCMLHQLACMYAFRHIVQVALAGRLFSIGHTCILHELACMYAFRHIVQVALAGRLFSIGHTCMLH
jgi:hypothetical protein